MSLQAEPVILTLKLFQNLQNKSKKLVYILKKTGKIIKPVFFYINFEYDC